MVLDLCKVLECGYGRETAAVKSRHEHPLERALDRLRTF